MAKKNDAAYEAFLADLKGIVPEIEGILANNEKASSKLREGVLARSEFSSQMDALQKEREQMQQYLSSEKQKIEGWQKWYGDTTAEVARMQQELSQYVEEYGELSDAGKRREAAKQGYTKEEFDKRLNEEIQKLAQAHLKFTEDLTDIKIQHRDEFKERLDTDSLYKIAGEKNVPLTVAYNEMVADKRKERDEALFQEKLKQAREEGAREFASKHNLPLVPSNADIHVLDVPADTVGKTANDRIKAAAESFMKSVRS